MSPAIADGLTIAKSLGLASAARSSTLLYATRDAQATIAVRAVLGARWNVLLFAQFDLPETTQRIAALPEQER